MPDEALGAGMTRLCQAGKRTEYVVIVDEQGRAVGTAPKADVHGDNTPLHLAFSCYGFNSLGQLLVTRRSPAKRTFPGLWSNTCCGHQAPGEAIRASVSRRMRQELGLHPRHLKLVLPSFRYTAGMNGIFENEICPVFLCRIASTVAPDPTEVCDTRWQPWADYVESALAPGSRLSPWTILQVRELIKGRHVEAYLESNLTTTI
jgi:isopentenyl-diphosphate delta-isomerase